MLNTRTSIQNLDKKLQSHRKKHKKCIQEVRRILMQTLMNESLRGLITTLLNNILNFSFPLFNRLVPFGIVTTDKLIQAQIRAAIDSKIVSEVTRKFFTVICTAKCTASLDRPQSSRKQLSIFQTKQ